jgi:hypothetical protein
LAQPFALALGASGFLFADYDGFKLVIAFLADVFKNRHISGSVKILQHHYYRRTRKSSFQQHG